MNAEAEDWVRAHLSPSGPIEAAHVRPWATVSRVPLAGGVAWFKECRPVQAFEPTLTASLSARWPLLAPEVVAYDVERSWLLLADAGAPVRSLGNPPEYWMDVLPAYADLQRGEAAHADDHLSCGVPDLRLVVLPERYGELLDHELPLEPGEVESLRAFTPRFVELCQELETLGIPPSVQHDDLHMNNLYVDGSRLRIIDWGDASIGHPFFSLVITFRFLEQFNGLTPGDPWFGRLRHAYLEPWGSGHTTTFDLALRVGAFARAFQSIRLRDFLEADGIAPSNEDFKTVLRRALATTKSP